MTATSEIAFQEMVRKAGLEDLQARMNSCGWRTACLFAQACGLNHASPKEVRFNKLVVFGDSGSDTGNFWSLASAELKTLSTTSGRAPSEG